MVEKAPTTEESKGKLPLDIPVQPDDKGNVKLEKDETKAAPPKETKAQEGDKAKELTVDGEVKAPEPRTYSEEEHNRVIESIKGGHKGTVSKLTGDMKALSEQLETLQTQYEEKEIAGWLKAVEERGSEDEVSVAKAIAERDRESRRIARDIARTKAELDAQSTLLEQAGRGKAVYDLIKTYGLDEEATEELLKAESPTEMENKALKLHVEKIKADARNPENPPKATKVSPKGVDRSGWTPEQRLGQAAQDWEDENK